MRIAWAVLVSLGLVATSTMADTITVRTSPGYPSPGQGYARLELKLVRPTQRATTPTSRIETVFREVESAVNEASITSGWSLLVPDAESLDIVVEIDGRTIRLSSCHMYFESDPQLVVTSRGVESLGSRSRNDVLANQPPSFQRGRKAFERSVAAVKAFVHAKGQVFP